LEERQVWGPIRYRRLQEADIAAISRVHRSACLIAYRFMDWSHTEEQVRDWYSGKFAEWDWALVAEAERVVGFVATPGSHVDQLFVAPEHQRTGIATRLFGAALDRISGPVTLNVFGRNMPGASTSGTASKR
jgi:putative acetyltransferase